MASNTDVDFEIAKLHTAPDDELGIGLLLIGGSGSGKSALGNSILGHKAFASVGGFFSITKSHCVGRTKIRGHTVTVVDTPGLDDTDLGTKKRMLNSVIDEVTNALAYFPNGFHVVIPVIPYTSRMEEGTETAIDTMVALLGVDALESHGILAITHGDRFQSDNNGKKDDAVFKASRKSLGPGLQRINTFCKGRCVLFDNVTGDEDEKRCQREKLVELVEKLKTRERYIPDICKVNVHQRARIIKATVKLTKYMQGARALDRMISKIYESVIENPPLTQEFEMMLKEEARTLTDIWKRDKVFGTTTLVEFSAEIDKLDHRGDTETIANGIIQVIRALQLKIDDRIESPFFRKYLKDPSNDFNPIDSLYQFRLLESELMDGTNINFQEAGEIGLLLIGATGSGKSALGNSILGRKHFESKGGFGAITKEYKMGMTVINGRIVKVVDTPGLNDTDLTTKNERLDLVIDEITKSLAYFPDGFHAIVPVIPYIQRMVDDAKETIDTMISLLGPKALEERGILAITYGDIFKQERGDDEVDSKFKEYMEKLEPRHQWVNDLCKRRCVLYDNNPDSKYDKKGQQKALLTLLDSHKARGLYKPEICNTRKDKRATAIRDKNQLTKYVKGARALGILIFKIRTAVIDDPQFNENSKIVLRHDADTLTDMLKTDQVFGKKALESFITEMKKLTSAVTDDREELLKIANNVIGNIRKMQLTIDSKMKSTLYWQELKMNVVSFFEKMRSMCNMM